MQVEVHDQRKPPKSPKNKRSIPTPILFTLGPCTKSLNPSQPRRKHAEKMIPHPIEAPLGLGSREDGWIWVLGFGVRNERGRAWARAEHGEGEGEGGEKRESDLNTVGPKMVDISQTGKTGCRDRSDRSGPGWQEVFWFCALSCEFKTNDFN